MDSKDKIEEVRNINTRLKKAGEVIKYHIDPDTKEKDTYTLETFDIPGQLNILDFL